MLIVKACHGDEVIRGVKCEGDVKACHGDEGIRGVKCEGDDDRGNG